MCPGCRSGFFIYSQKMFCFTFYCGFAEVKLKSVSLTLYSLSPSCISLLSRTIKMSGLEVAMAQVAGPTHTHKQNKKTKQKVNKLHFSSNPAWYNQSSDGPILAPFLSRAMTAEVFLQPTARSRGRIPLQSTCSTDAP